MILKFFMWVLWNWNPYSLRAYTETLGGREEEDIFILVKQMHNILAPSTLNIAIWKCGCLQKEKNVN